MIFFPDCPTVISISTSWIWILFFLRYVWQSKGSGGAGGIEGMKRPERSSGPAGGSAGRKDEIRKGVWGCFLRESEGRVRSDGW